MTKGQKRRNTTVIDALIKAHYPTKGADYIAELTGEDRKYLITRAHFLKVKRNKTTPPRAPSKSEQIKILQERNKTLRLENIKLIQERKIYENLYN